MHLMRHDFGVMEIRLSETDVNRYGCSPTSQQSLVVAVYQPLSLCHYLLSANDLPLATLHMAIQPVPRPSV